MTNIEPTDNDDSSREIRLSMTAENIQLPSDDSEESEDD